MASEGFTPADNNSSWAEPLFVVVEGLDATGKTTLCARLAEHLNAATIKCPPEISVPGFDELRCHFDAQEPTVRRAYYRAGNLVASEWTRRRLHEDSQTVVMDRYWPSTVSFSSGEELTDQSFKNNGGYPPELLIPDIVILLTVDEQSRKSRMMERGDTVTAEEQELEARQERREAIIREYRKFDVVEIDTTNLTREDVTTAAMTLICGSMQTKSFQNLWGGCIDCWCSPPFEAMQSDEQSTVYLQPSALQSNDSVGSWPEELSNKILYGLTGWNPCGKKTPEDVNRAANTNLQLHIESLAQSFPSAVQWWHGLGFDAATQWKEEGFVVMFDCRVLQESFITSEIHNMAKEFLQGAYFKYHMDSDKRLIRHLISVCREAPGPGQNANQDAPVMAMVLSTSAPKVEDDSDTFADCGAEDNARFNAHSNTPYFENRVFYNSGTSTD